MQFFVRKVGKNKNVKKTSFVVKKR